MAEQRYLQRHHKQTRITHGIFVVSCIWLMISGLFVFIPQLAAAVGADVAQAMRVSHRVVGCIFILTPIVSAIASPKGARNFVGKYTYKWDADDKEWMKKFVPYMLGPKRVHMPDAKEVKSGQVVADGAIMVSAFMMMVSGLMLWLGGVYGADAGLMGIARLLHDIFFLLLVVFVIAHIYLGAGIFQPYKRSLTTMWGDGKISESDALYHWGKWAREKIEAGEVVEDK
jgi:formate dehydrogenase subunit gamma